jgi:hypothetical protein
MATGEFSLTDFSPPILLDFSPVSQLLERSYAALR